MLQLCHYYATTMPLLCHLRLIMPLNFQKGPNYATHYASIVQNPHRAKLCQAYAGRIAFFFAISMCDPRNERTNSFFGHHKELPHFSDTRRNGRTAIALTLSRVAIMIQLVASLRKGRATINKIEGRAYSS
jgi:hypothetical protein